MQLTRLKENLTIRRIVFIGFMGCGKTTISEEIQKYINEPLYNIDKIIQLQEQRTISDIFFHRGEKFFRDTEEKIISSLTMNSTGIIDCGGGAVEREVNMRHLGTWGEVFWLDCPLEIIQKRVENSDRPLLQNKGHKELKDFYLRRNQLYKKYSKHRIDSSREIQIIINNIMEILSKG
ncbi:shikimate kinase [Alkalicella caledoniensis]|uniref:Shikimate kinase n=1 Tax=Alkalicella caledoniensis TaxID=2731377 RepID=A0A7G9WBN8_ALKCA|nr:shikimate kinase [Alkalicella caledoniensis]QNO16100.1 shikimate kinase [Alkalicella caledoniensis]